MSLRALIICLTFAVEVCAQSPPVRDTWVDKSPHRSGFAKVKGVKLHYLDWGGTGETLLLLSGFNNSAHIYDTFAPQFTDRFRVLGLTRRGHGQSEKPLAGYDTDTLVEDLRQFLDLMNISQVTLVGHSMAGNELTRFAGLYFKRVKHLVYLDAAFDYSDGFLDLMSSSPQEPPPRRADLESLDSFSEYSKVAKCGWSEAWEAELRNIVSFTREGHLLKPKSVMPERVSKAVQDAMVATRPDYTKVKVPALSMVATAPFPECSLAPDMEEGARKKAQVFFRRLMEYRRRNVERFRREVIGSQVLEMPNTDHWLFIHKEAEVVRAMRRFLLPPEVQ